MSPQLVLAGPLSKRQARQEESYEEVVSQPVWDLWSELNWKHVRQTDNEDPGAGKLLES